jgi:hypothetical protein
MATKIVTKNSSTASAVPTASDLVQGELAVNVTDKRLFTEDNGGSIVELGTNPSGNVTFQDNGKAIFGAGSDLQIYHDGNHSYISEQGTGNLRIYANDLVLANNDGSQTFLYGQNGGPVSLSYANNAKLATTSTGIDVTGTATMDGLVVDGRGTIYSGVLSEQSQLRVGYSSDYHWSLGRENAVTGDLLIESSVTGTDTARMRVGNNGDISFYEDTGTTAKFFWDASAESLGIGNTVASSMNAGANQLVVGSGSTGQGITLYSSTSTAGSIHFADGTSGSEAYRGQLLYNHNGDYMAMYTAASEAMRIDASGNVGIGKTPNTNFGGYVLQLNGGSQTFMSFGNSTTGTTLSDGLVIGNDNSGADIYQREAQPLRFHTSNTERMRIDSSGNVTVKASGADQARTLSLQGTNGASETYQFNLIADGENAAAKFMVGVGGGAATERMRIDSSGRVGIGTSSPSQKLHVYESSTGSQAYVTVQNNRSRNAAVLTQTTNGGFYTGTSIGTDTLCWQVYDASAGERMRIDSSGNLLVGKTTTGVAGAGTVIRAGGELFVTRAGDVMNLNRLSTDGQIAYFRKDGAVVGSIGTTSSTMWIAGNSTQDTGIRCYTVGIAPCNSSGVYQDNSRDLGSLTVRWDDIYATNGTIQTSDFNEKQDIAELTDAEQRVAVAAKGLLRKFRWKDSVAEKGDEARTHFGIIAQDLQAAFAAEGLDASDYAMFISSTWTDEETNEEKTRMGVRYSELLAFIIAAI